GEQLGRKIDLKPGASSDAVVKQHDNSTLRWSGMVPDDRHCFDAASDPRVRHDVHDRAHDRGRFVRTVRRHRDTAPTLTRRATDQLLLPASMSVWDPCQEGERNRGAN